jgi:hypothetical protein
MMAKKPKVRRIIDSARDPRFFAPNVSGAKVAYLRPEDPIPDFVPPEHLRPKKIKREIDLRQRGRRGSQMRADPMKPAIVQNPLRMLCDQMGLEPEYLGRLAGLTPRRVARAIRDMADGGGLADFILLMGMLRIRLRVEAAPPFSFWISNIALDALLTNNDWRRSMRMCPCPRKTKDVRTTVESLHKRGLSYNEIARYMSRHFIPGGYGTMGWDLFKVANVLRCRTQRIRRMSNLRCELRKSWRAFVVSTLLQRMFPADLMVSLRYGMTAEHLDDHVRVSASLKIPAFIVDQVTESLRKLAWFPAHEWGMGYGPATASAP